MSVANVAQLSRTRSPMRQTAREKRLPPPPSGRAHSDKRLPEQQVCTAEQDMNNGGHHMPVCIDARSGGANEQHAEEASESMCFCKADGVARVGKDRP